MALFQCNTSNVHEMKFGRPQTVLNDAVRPNGVIVTLGETQEKVARELDHCHAISEGALAEVVGAFVVVAPEINAQQYRTIDGQIGKFALEAGETYSAYMLQKHDRLEYSDAYFEAVPAVGAKVNVKVGTGLAPRFSANGAALRVVSVTELWLPIMLQPNNPAGQGAGADAKLMPESCKMIKVEVVK